MPTFSKPDIEDDETRLTRGDDRRYPTQPHFTNRFSAANWYWRHLHKNKIKRSKVV